MKVIYRIPSLDLVLLQAISVDVLSSKLEVIQPTLARLKANDIPIHERQTQANLSQGFVAYRQQA